MRAYIAPVAGPQEWGATRAASEAERRAKLQGPLQERCTARSKDAAPVKLNAWFGPSHDVQSANFTVMSVFVNTASISPLRANNRMPSFQNSILPLVSLRRTQMNLPESG